MGSELRGKGGKVRGRVRGKRQEIRGKRQGKRQEVRGKRQGKRQGKQKGRGQLVCPCPALQLPLLLQFLRITCVPYLAQPFLARTCPAIPAAPHTPHRLACLLPHPSPRRSNCWRSRSGRRACSTRIHKLGQGLRRLGYQVRLSETKLTACHTFVHTLSQPCLTYMGFRSDRTWQSLAAFEDSCAGSLRCPSADQPQC